MRRIGRMFSAVWTWWTRGTCARDVDAREDGVPVEVIRRACAAAKVEAERLRQEPARRFLERVFEGGDTAVLDRVLEYQLWGPRRTAVSCWLRVRGPDGQWVDRRDGVVVPGDARRN